MHAENFLLQVRTIDAEIRRQESIVEEIRHSLEPQAIRYDKDKVQSTPEDPMAQMMVRLDAKREKIEQLKIHRAEVMLEIDRVLCQLEDEEEQMVLTHWYLFRENAETVSESVPCSVRTMYKLKASGLGHVEDLLQNKVCSDLQ